MGSKLCDGILDDSHISDGEIQLFSEAPADCHIQLHTIRHPSLPVEQSAVLPMTQEFLCSISRGIIYTDAGRLHLNIRLDSSYLLLYSFAAPSITSDASQISRLVSHL